MVKPGRAVAGKVLGVGGAVVAVLAAAYIFRNTDAGSKIIQSLRGAGNVGGQALLAPIEGLLSGVAAGTGSIAQQGTAIGANLASFAEAIAAGDFQSIIDGSYIRKYGAPGDQSKPNTQPAPTTPAISRPTIQDERPNDKSSTRSNFQPQPKAMFDLNAYLSRQAQAARATAANIRATTGTGGTPFGGFSSAAKQESALQSAIAAARRKYPQYFR